MRSILLSALVLLVAGARPAGAQAPAFDPNAPPYTIRLWEAQAPGATGNADADVPTLEIFRAGRGPGPAIIVAPGGAYSALSMNSEGRQVAAWLNTLGVSAYVLKYRIAPYRHPVEMQDAQRAIRLVRARAAELGAAPDRIGFMGFSAGGHLASTVGTHFDPGSPAATDPIERASSRPDFLVLIYPVISFQPAIAGPSVLTAYANSGRNLLGDSPDPRLLDELSNELHVTAETPPTFIYHGTADRLVGVENGAAFFLALRKAGVPAELHTFEAGQHGGGLNAGATGFGTLPMLIANWMRNRGLLSVPSTAVPATASAAPPRPAGSTAPAPARP